MQFYQNYVRLCNQAGKKPTAVAEEAGIARATASRWSRGMVPNYANLLKIADYFGISVGELVGATPETVQNIADYYGLSPELILDFKKPESEKSVEQSVVEKYLERVRSSSATRALLDATDDIDEKQVRIIAEFIKKTRGGE